jgi:hypothetical protein
LPKALVLANLLILTDADTAGSHRPRAVSRRLHQVAQ